MVICGHIREISKVTNCDLEQDQIKNKESGREAMLSF
jgi:hypothetical protein